MPTILAIDDDPIIQFLLKRILQDQGYEVVLTDNGEDGLELAYKLRPALIVCDWVLPGIDGLEVCRQIRQSPELASSFFILLTARATTDDLVRGLDAGADEFLAKPIVQNELKARVRAGLRLYQANYDLQIQKQLLESELDKAAHYVQTILPKPVSEPLRIDSRYIPSMRLSGDCFDYFWLDPDYLAIYLVDIAGHGIGSALLSISVLNLLRSQSLKQVNFYQPHMVLSMLNQSFQMSGHGLKYFTIWYGVYNRQSRQLIYAGAGHPPALLLSGTGADMQVTELTAQNEPIGFFPDTDFVSSWCDVPVGSELCVFSDGIYEFFPDKNVNQHLGLANFINLLKQFRREQGINLDELIHQLTTLLQQSGYDDDVSILTVQLA
jgi:phosphoserine phosphatase RsbU/P